MSGSSALMPSRPEQSFLCFDYGLKRVGVASGNTVLGHAQPLCTIALEGPARFERIAELVTQWRPDALVVGVPLHPDGAEHENTLRARRFARQLAGRHSLPVHEVDERYTTVEAQAQSSGRRAEGTSTGAGSIDARAAAVILQQFLDAQT